MHLHGRSGLDALRNIGDRRDAGTIRHHHPSRMLDRDGEYQWHVDPQFRIDGNDLLAVARRDIKHPAIHWVTLIALRVEDPELVLLRVGSITPYVASGGRDR